MNKGYKFPPKYQWVSEHPTSMSRDFTQRFLTREP
jgi:hypothetical protein